MKGALCIMVYLIHPIIRRLGKMRNPVYRFRLVLLYTDAFLITLAHHKMDIPNT